MDAVKKTGKNIQSVQRAIDILNCFTAANPALSLGEISARLQLNKATVHGILNTLHNNGDVWAVLKLQEANGLKKEEFLFKHFALT